MSRTSTPIQVSTLTITVTDTSFQTGYEIGYRQYVDLYAGKTLSDQELLSILLDNLAGIAHTCTHKIGVVTGWYAALYAYDQHRIEVRG